MKKVVHTLGYSISGFESIVSEYKLSRFIGKLWLVMYRTDRCHARGIKIVCLAMYQPNGSQIKNIWILARHVPAGTWRRVWDSNPRPEKYGHGLANRSFGPLRQLSKFSKALW